MKVTNTLLNKTSTRKATLRVDKNGHYYVSRYRLTQTGWQFIPKGRELFKHLHTAERAAHKWIDNK